MPFITSLFPFAGRPGLLVAGCLGCVISACASAPPSTAGTRVQQAPAPPMALTPTVAPTPRVVIEYVKISPAWVQRFVRTNPADLATWAADSHNAAHLAEVRHILVRVEEDADADAQRAAKKRATALLNRIKSGEDFATVARQGSEDASKDQGGALGTDTSKFVEPFRVAADALAPGAFTRELVRSSYGWHIIKKDLITPEGILAAYRRQAAPEVAKRIAAEILTQRRTGRASESAITDAAASLLDDGANADSARPVARTFDPESAKGSIEACRDQKEMIRRLIAQRETDSSTLETLLCKELDALSQFSARAAPGATMTSPAPFPEAAPLVAFASAVP